MEEKRDKRFGKRERRPCEYQGCHRLNEGGYQAHCHHHRSQRIRQGLPVLYHADKPARKGRYFNEQTGYWLLLEKTHPLATKAGYVYEHRVVAYTKYGPGPLPCHWCGKSLQWQEIEVDHVDWERANNHPDNLVASCPQCNAARREGSVVKRTQPKLEMAKRLLAVARMRD